MSATPNHDLDAVRTEALRAFAAAGDLAALDEARTRHLGKRSGLAAVQRTLGGLDPDGRRTLGRAVNEARTAMAAAESARRDVLVAERDERILAAEALDVTLPPRTPRRGSLHPIPSTIESILDVMTGLGYRVLDGGPEVETDWHNFDALNTPADHPARTLNDTIYVAPDPRGSVDVDRGERPGGTTGTPLRAHTSPMQLRAMHAYGAPLYVVVPGRAFRQDTPDATHLPVFHQIEGLAIDRGLSLANLKGTLETFARALLGPDVETRLRPHFFPFTEPSPELDVRIGDRWVELLGSGMVHPNVLRAGGLDPEEFSGFAWGMGVERLAMARAGIADIRLLADNDLRFLSAFTTA